MRIFIVLILCSFVQTLHAEITALSLEGRLLSMGGVYRDGAGRQYRVYRLDQINGVPGVSGATWVDVETCIANCSSPIVATAFSGSQTLGNRFKASGLYLASNRILVRTASLTAVTAAPMPVPTPTPAPTPTPTPTPSTSVTLQGTLTYQSGIYQDFSGRKYRLYKLNTVTGVSGINNSTVIEIETCTESCLSPVPLTAITGTPVIGNQIKATGTYDANNLILVKVTSLSVVNVQPAPAPTPTPAPAPVGSQVTVYPTESFAFLPNPGIGWMTMFIAGIDDKTIPSGVTSTVYYNRYNWADIHRGNGIYDFSYIDNDLQRARLSGQRMMIRIMPVWQQSNAPQWMKQMGVPGYNFNLQGINLWIPDFNNLTVQNFIAAFITEMGKKYNNHPDIDSVELNLLGLFGEGHFQDITPSVPLPSATTIRWLVDLHYKNFPNKPLLGPIFNASGATAYMYSAYGATKGAGIFLDCWGDYGAGWNHMNVGYPQWLGESGLNNAWKAGIIKLEPCGVMGQWASQIPQALDWAIQNHASIIGNKSTTVPSGYHDDIAEALKKIGYRYVIRSLSHPSTAQRSATLNVSLKIDNIGNAPSYDPYVVAIQLRSASGQVVSTTLSSHKVTSFLPGSRDSNIPVSVPSSLIAGQTYQIAVSIVESSTGAAKVRLANTGRDATGWYPLSQIMVQ